MKLYSGPLSLFTAKVRIALDEKGLDYDRVEVGWSREDRYLPHHPDVVALNPGKQHPSLLGWFDRVGNRLPVKKDADAMLAFVASLG